MTENEIIQTVTKGIDKWLDDILEEGTKNLEWVDDAIYDTLPEVGKETKTVSVSTSGVGEVEISFLDLTSPTVDSLLEMLRDRIEENFQMNVSHPLRYVSDLIINRKLPVSERISLFETVKDMWMSALGDPSTVEEIKETPKWKEVCVEVSSAIGKRVRWKLEDINNEHINSSIQDLLDALLQIIHEYHISATKFVKDLIETRKGMGEISRDILNKFLTDLQNVYKNTLTDFQYMFKHVDDLNFQEVSPKVNPQRAVTSYLTDLYTVVLSVLDAVGEIKAKTLSETYQTEVKSAFGQVIEEGAESEGVRRIDEAVRRRENELGTAQYYLDLQIGHFPVSDVNTILSHIQYLLYYKNYTRDLHQAVGKLFTSEWVDSFLTKRLKEDVSDFKITDLYLLFPEEEEELRNNPPKLLTKSLRKEKKELTPTEVWERILKGDKETIEDLTKFLAKLFLLFLHDWFNWEIFGWLLAVKLGFTPEQIQRYPELGWFAKAVTAYLLIRSDDRDTRLLGRALLYHTEIPPEHVYVKVGGDFLPAVVDHYRRSAKHTPIIKEMERIFEILASE